MRQFMLHLVLVGTVVSGGCNSQMQSQPQVNNHNTSGAPALQNPLPPGIAAAVEAGPDGLHMEQLPGTALAPDQVEYTRAMFHFAIFVFYWVHDRFPASMTELEAAALIPWLPAGPDGQPIRLVNADPSLPLSNVYWQVDWSQPDVIQAAALQFVHPITNPKGVFALVHREREVRDKIAHKQNVAGHVKRSIVEMQEESALREAEGRYGTPPGRAMVTAAELPPHRVWMLRQAVKHLLFHYRTNTGSWPESFDAVLEEFRLVPAPGFFAYPASGQYLRADIDPSLDYLSMTLLTVYGKPHTSHWLYEQTQPASASLNLLSYGLRDKRLNGQTPQPHELVTFWIADTP